MESKKVDAVKNTLLTLTFRGFNMNIKKQILHSYTAKFFFSTLLTKLLMLIPLLLEAQDLEPKKVYEQEAFTVEVYGSGPPIYLIPGLASSGDVWEGTVNRFKDQYECHVFTLAGFAQKPATGKTPFLETMNKEITNYIKDREPGLIVGHSLGGVLTLIITSENEQLVQKGIVVDAYPFLAALMQPGVTEQDVQFPRQMLKNQVNQMDSIAYRNRQRNTLQTMVSAEKDLENVLEWSMQSDRTTVVNAMADIMQTDLRDDIKEIEIPVLVMLAGNISSGEQGTVSKSQIMQTARNQYEQLEDKTLKVAGEAKHFIMLDDPEWFYQTMEAYFNASD
ncbi:MAG TPA: alpha/beta hydrolase [Salinivirga sp.]|uniref:alpha/beta fold hydrolase n=1 Tax=Salinivirga sp. TaxID=1970192 RepID=UPI002B47BEB2|nr:alpha/beta hydrolase [Salinivirga sp.]HKK60379.1 alpha/beta hydrolase [Salinivirga sp.]